MERGGSKLAYEPALDGLRALAVTAVLAYHAGVAGISGGFLGVDVFLVLSGYLITALLLEEQRARGQIDLRSFWVRRMRRLLPALTLVVGAVLIHATVTRTVDAARADVVASLAGFQNWHLALADVSYFAGLADASPLRHAWSLALEMQWYLVWPAVVIVGLRTSGGRTLRLAVAAVVLGAASVGVMAMLHVPGADPSRAYFGSDARAHVLLVGAVLALTLHRRTAPRPGAAWGPAGVAGLAVVAWALHRSQELDPLVYEGGFAVVAVATAAVIGASLRSGTVVQRLLRLPPMPALGRISYGVYLWHWPLYVWIGPSWSSAALAVGLAAASYRLVEMPLRTARPRRSRLPAIGMLAASTVAVVAVAVLVPLTPNRGLTPASRPVSAAASTGEGAGEGAPVTRGDVPGERRPAGVSRVLLAGDSVAFTLGEHYRAEWSGSAVHVDASASLLGCGIARAAPINEGHPLVWDADLCNRWPERWRAGIDTVDPDVVVVLVGAWEVLDLMVDGERASPGSPAHTGHLRAQLDTGLDLLREADVPAVVLTAPCYRPYGELPGWSTSDRADDRRVDLVNGVIRDVVGDHPGGASLLDLHHRLCPDGRFLDRVGGAPVRTDGVHFTPEGARYVWEWLLPELRGEDTAPISHEGPTI